MFKIGNKILNLYLGLGLKLKFVYFIIFLIIVPFIGVLVFLLQALSKVSLETERKTIDETTLLIRQELLNNVSAKSQIYDQKFKYMIIDLEKTKETIISNAFNEKMLSDFFYKYQPSSTFFVAPEGSISLFPEIDTFTEKNIDLSKIEQFNFLESKEKIFLGTWVGPYDDFKGNGRILTYILPVIDSDKNFGFVGFDLTVSGLFTNIARIDPSQSSYVFLVRSDGNFISSSDTIYEDFEINKEENQNKFESNFITNNGFAELLLTTSRREGSLILSEKGEDSKIVTFSIIPTYQGKIFVVSPINEILLVQKENAKLIQQAVGQVGLGALVYLGTLGVFLVLMSFYMSGKYIIKPINKLKDGIEDFEKTGVNTDIEIESKDELGMLATSFNNMTAKLRDYQQGLEQKIEARTREIEEKIKELEKFKSLTIGRELKMIDLKKEMEELKQELEETKKLKKEAK